MVVQVHSDIHRQAEEAGPELRFPVVDELPHDPQATSATASLSAAIALAESLQLSQHAANTKFAAMKGCARCTSGPSGRMKSIKCSQADRLERQQVGITKHVREEWTKLWKR